MNIPTVTQEDDITHVSSAQKKRVTFSDNVSYCGSDHGATQNDEPHGSAVSKWTKVRRRKVLRRIPCKRPKSLIQRNLFKKMVVPSRYKATQVRSFDKQRCTVSEHTRRTPTKRDVFESQDTMPFIDEASKMIIRSLLIQDKIDMARGKF